MSNSYQVLHNKVINVYKCAPLHCDGTVSFMIYTLQSRCDYYLHAPTKDKSDHIHGSSYKELEHLFDQCAMPQTWTDFLAQ